MIYISEYSVSREYGGPEEGGWWYDNPMHVRLLAIADNQEYASKIARALNSAENITKPDRYSMAGSDDTVFYSEESLGDHELKEQPYYE